MFKGIKKSALLMHALYLLSILLVVLNLESSGNSSLAVSTQEVANFISGIELPRQSQLYKHTLTANYTRYKEEMKKSWESFQGPNLKKIVAWRKKHITNDYPKSMLYPFSGPDIVHALAFYPKSRFFIMFGMETPGQVPNPHVLTPGEIISALAGLKTSLADILKYNFFFTNNMKKEVGTHQFNGILGVKMFLLTRYGCKIREARLIWIDSKGVLQYSKNGLDLTKAIPGCEIIFQFGDDKYPKTSQFFQMDVSNKSLLNRPNFIHYLKRQGRFTTLLKAASYLMHSYNRHYQHFSFSFIRSFIMRRSNLIIQDDSGIPLWFFSRYDWELIFYGRHEEPINMFEERYQEALVDVIDCCSRGQLPFSYGYYIHPYMCHIMIAKARNIR